MKNKGTELEKARKVVQDSNLTKRQNERNAKMLKKMIEGILVNARWIQVNY